MLDRAGCVLLEMAPAVDTRSYDWAQKQTFSLSVTELGDLLVPGPVSFEAFHDPYKASGGWIGVWGPVQGR